MRNLMLFLFFYIVVSSAWAVNPAIRFSRNPCSDNNGPFRAVDFYRGTHEHPEELRLFLPAGLDDVEINFRGHQYDVDVMNEIYFAYREGQRATNLNFVFVNTAAEANTIFTYGTTDPEIIALSTFMGERSTLFHPLVLTPERDHARFHINSPENISRRIQIAWDRYNQFVDPDINPLEFIKIVLRFVFLYNYAHIIGYVPAVNGYESLNRVPNNVYEVMRSDFVLPYNPPITMTDFGEYMAMWVKFHRKKMSTADQITFNERECASYVKVKLNPHRHCQR